MHRFFNCVGSFLLQRQEIQEGTFENVSSEYAEKGTGAHELGAVCLAGDLEPYELLGEEFNGYLAGWPGGIELDAVQIYVNECRDIMERCDYDGVALVEKTFSRPDIHPLLKGTIDFGYVSQKHGYFLRDYKNGEGVGVYAQGNEQLLYYAFLLLLISRANFGFDDKTPFSLGIVQPNHFGIFEAPEVWETTVGFVWKWGHEELLPRMRALTNTPEYHLREDDTSEDFVTGDHCQFCPVMLSCPKMQAAYAQYADASEDFVTMLTNGELDDLYAQRENVRRFMTALENTVRARMIATPGVIKSAKLVEKKVARVWKPGAQAALLEAFGEKAWQPREIISPAGAEKLSSRGKELALEYGYKPESAGLTIAPLSDPRAEAKPRTNAMVFEGHAQEPEALGF